MKRRETNLPVETGMGPSVVVCARVTSVDTRRRVVSLSTIQTGQEFHDIQLMSPYQHYRGEGMRWFPDIDAVCMVQIPSDGTPPYVQGFLDIPAMVTPQEMEAGSGAEEQPVSEEEGQMSYASASPPTLPGEMLITLRDGNFLNLRRGGIVELGATALCQRIFSPLRNLMQDYAENYELLTVAGTLAMRTDRAEDSADGESGTRFQLLMNEKASDARASVSLEVGRVTDDMRLRLVVSPQGVAHDTGQYEEARIEISLDASGRVRLTSVENVEIELDGDLKMETGGSMEFGTRAHRLRADSSDEQIMGAKTIAAGALNLQSNVAVSGSFVAPGVPVLRGPELFAAWAASHKHDPVSGLPVPPPP